MVDNEAGWRVIGRRYIAGSLASAGADARAGRSAGSRAGRSAGRRRRGNGRPDHRGDKLFVGNPGRRCREHDLTVANDRDVLADLEYLLQMMRDIHDGYAAGDQLPDPLE